MKALLKQILPETLILLYHRMNAKIAVMWYRNPSAKLMVIGVTGTKGKSTTANFIWSVLQHSGHKTALTGTANFRIGNDETMNPYHLSMPGPWILQKFLARAVHEGCSHAVVEVTSEGIKQSRHHGIDVDAAVFTNLTPEHLPSHNNSFEEYRDTKLQLFTTLNASPKQHKFAVLNADSDHCEFFADAITVPQVRFSITAPSDVRATNIAHSSHGVQFSVNHAQFVLKMPGFFNVHNALAAVAIGRQLGLSLDSIAQGLSALSGVPGRMEVIDEGQDFSVWVDYAHEKESMGGLLDTLRAIKRSDSQKIIIHLGAEGGGRDKAKRPIMGKQVGQYADYVVVGNVDPYEDDPAPIIEDIVVAAEAEGKVRGKTIFAIEDRRGGIAKALALAKPGDLVAITGKGAEQTITIGGKTTPWDDRVVVKEELKKLLKKSTPQPITGYGA